MVRIPNEYQEVEYLQSVPGAYINSGVQITADLMLEITFNVVSIINGKYLFGHFSNNSGSFYLYISTGQYFQLAYGCNYKNSSFVVDTEKHLLRCEIFGNDTYAYIDGVEVFTETDTQHFPNENIYIAGSSHTSSIPCNTYSVKMIKNGELIRNFIPCCRKSDNEPGMYDTITGTFYTNSGTGTFTVGNDVSYSTTNLTETRRKILLHSPHLEAASGNICTFSTDMTAKLKSCRVNFLPKQAGSGDPSPDNVRAVSGTDGVEVTRCGKNLINWSLYPFTDKRAFTPQSVSATTGEIAQNNYHCATLDFIPCEHLRGKSIVITPYQSSNGYASICFYETANASSYISAANHTVVVPMNASYMRFCIPRAYINDDKILEIGTEPTAYEPCTAETLSVTFPAQGKNLFDVTSYPLSESGFYVAGSNGVYATTTAAMKATFVFVPCQGYQGMTLTLNKRPGGSSAGIAFYSSADQSTYISGYNNNGATANTSWTFVVPDNANYMRFTVPSDANDIQIELGSMATTYEPYTNAVYGGYLDLLNGELLSTYAITDLGTCNWTEDDQTIGLFRSGRVNFSDIKYFGKNYCGIYKSTQRRTAADLEQGEISVTNSVSNPIVRVRDERFVNKTADEVKEMLSGVMFVYEQNSPSLVGALIPQQIHTLNNTNYIYSNADSIDASYWTHICKLNTSPRIAQYDKSWGRSYGTLNDTAGWCITDWYEFIPTAENLSPFTLVGYVGTDVNNKTFQYYYLNNYDWYYFNNTGTSTSGTRDLDPNGKHSWKYISFSIDTSKLDEAFVYVQDTGQILFAGKNTPYYGHKNISEL